MLYVNDPSLAVKVPYETEDEMEKAVTGKKKSEGGILPDDNVTIYVPMDLNVDGIMRQLYAFHMMRLRSLKIHSGSEWTKKECHRKSFQLELG